MIRAMPAAAAEAERIISASCQPGSSGRCPLQAQSRTAASMPHADCKKVRAARMPAVTGCMCFIRIPPFLPDTIFYAGAGRTVPIRQQRILKNR